MWVMVSRRKAGAQVILLATGGLFIALGILRGEMAEVLAKAIKICLECVGIG